MRAEMRTEAVKSWSPGSISAGLFCLRPHFRRFRLISVPVIPIQVPELDGFGEVLGGNVGCAIEIRDGAGHAQHAVVSTGGEIHAAYGHLQGAFAGVIECA